MAANQCNGICFTGFADIVREGYGDEAWERVLGALGDELAWALRRGAIQSGKWYPIEWYSELHAVAQRELGVGRELATRVGYDSTVHDLTAGILRILVTFLSPKTVVAGAARIFGTYYKQGTMTIVESGAGFAQAAWRDCVGFDANIWADVFGGVEGGLLAAGGKDVRFTLISGGQDGDADAEGRAEWNE